MRKRFSQIVSNEETVYAESEDLRNYFGEFCTNQSSLHGETLFGDLNCWAGRRSQLVVKDSTITAFGRSILVWPTPGSPSHQKHGTLLEGNAARQRTRQAFRAARNARNLLEHCDPRVV
jgi:hypothetical protein